MNIRRGMKAALKANDRDQVFAFYDSDGPQTLRVLQMYVFDRPEVLIRWRAIDMLGELADVYAKDQDEVFRNIIRRFIWQMCEEGANVPWASPEVVGAMVAAVPGKQFEEFIGPLFFHAGLNEINHAGLFWAVGRLATHHAEQTRQFLPDILHRLTFDDPEIRGYGVWALNKLPLPEAKPHLEKLLEDERVQNVYDQGEFRPVNIAEGAKRALSKI